MKIKISEYVLDTMTIYIYLLLVCTEYLSVGISIKWLSAIKAQLALIGLYRHVTKKTKISLPHMRWKNMPCDFD